MEKEFLERYSAIIDRYGPMAEKLIRDAAFMAEKLGDLRDDIRRDGTKQKYQHGENQWGYQVNPDVTVYNTMIKNYNATIKQIRELMDKVAEDIPQGDDLDDFLTR